MAHTGANCGGCYQGLFTSIVGRRHARREELDLTGMGFLREPKCDKEFDEGGGDGAQLAFGSCSMQGWRLRNEDAQCCRIGLGGDPNCSLFAVFDGHGGPEVAKYCAKHLPVKLPERKSFSEGRFAQALRDSLLEMDTDILEGWPQSLSEMMPLDEDYTVAPLRSKTTNAIRCAPTPNSDPYVRGGPGCAALACVLHGGRIYVANVGDCRAVLSRAGKAIPLTVDHTPDLETESVRIFQAGGFVEDGRVNGSLNLSRAIGDFHFKRNHNLPPEAQVVSAEAETFTYDIRPEDEFLILGCDGVWDQFAAQQVVDFVRERLKARLAGGLAEDIGGMRLAVVAGELLDTLVAQNIYSSDGLGLDNMTCIIVDLSRAQSRGFLSSLYEKVLGG